jgi:glycosyltransferase involved in cell wall biosynthesis
MKKKVLIKGPILTRSGYGEHARFSARSLRSREDLFDIYIHPINWGQTSWTWEENEEREWIDKAIKKTFDYMKQGGQFDISLQVTIPQEWEKLAPINIGVTAGTETTKISAEWIEKCHLVDKIIVPSNHTKYAFENSVYTAVNKETNHKIEEFRCRTPVKVVSYPYKVMGSKPIDIDFETDFNFLTVGTWCVRKNIDSIVRGFVEEFIDNENVGLVIKTSIRKNCVIDREATVEKIDKILKDYEDRKCKIYLLHGDLLEEELNWVYQHPKIKALINLAHGEGFGLSLLEAAANELPIIAPAWSSYMDFLCAPKKRKNGKEKMKPHFLKVDYDIKPIQEEAVWEPVLIKDSMWCFPRLGSYKMTMRKCIKDYKIWKTQSKKLKKHILKNLTEENQYKEFVDCFEEYAPQFGDASSWLKELEARESPIREFE